MADTALTLITNALLDIGVLADEETPSASQAAGGLRKLNNMLEAWNIEDLLVYGQTAYTLPTVSNKAVYTVGVGGDLNIPRPNFINAATLRDTAQTPANQLDYPLYIMSDAEWVDVSFKLQTANWPAYGIYFNYTYPLIQVYLNPVPTSSQYNVILWIEGQLTSFSLNDTVTLSPGYKRALESNLSIEMAGSYGIEVPPSVVKIAQESKARLKIKNYRTNTLKLPSELYGNSYFDYYTGYSR